MKVLWHFYLPLPNPQLYVLAVLKQLQPVSHYGNRLVPSSRWCRSDIIYTLFCASVLICPRASWKNDVRHLFLFQQIGNTGWKSWQKLLKSATRWTHKWMMSETKDNWLKHTVDTHEAQWKLVKILWEIRKIKTTCVYERISQATYMSRAECVLKNSTIDP